MFSPILRQTLALTKTRLSIAFALLITGCTHTTLTPQGEYKPTKALTSTQYLSMATAIPVIASMASELVRDTEINIHYLPPPRYSIKRIPGWLKRQSTETFPKVDAIAGIASVWPDLDIYPALRVHNIQVVPIDVAHAYIPGGERVVITPNKSNQLGYFWLNPANALIMLGILERDLSNLIHQVGIDEVQVQQQADYLTRNMQDISIRLRQFQVNFDKILSKQDMMQVAIDSNDLYELASATLLPIVSIEEAMESDFPTLLITNKKPKHRNFKNLPSHLKLWEIDDFSKPRAGSFTDRWQKIISALEHN